MKIYQNPNLNIQNELASVAQGRLTLVSNTPVLTYNVTGANTIFYTPYTGNQINIWNGTQWEVRTFTELSLSLIGLTANTNYDVFIYDNSGTLALEAVAWSNSGAGTSTRASVLSWLNGVRVKDSDKRKYLGSFRTTNIGETEFYYSYKVRFFLMNEYNDILFNFYLADGNSHSYTGNERLYLNSLDYSLRFISERNINFNLQCITTGISIFYKLNGSFFPFVALPRIDQTGSMQWNLNVYGYNEVDTIEMGDGSAQYLTLFGSTYY